MAWAWRDLLYNYWNGWPGNTATDDAPWYVVTADNKWFTRVVVAAAVIDTLDSLDLRYPEVGEARLKELAVAKKELTANGDH
jgi:hypothetical protein